MRVSFAISGATIQIRSSHFNLGHPVLPRGLLYQFKNYHYYVSATYSTISGPLITIPHSFAPASLNISKVLLRVLLRGCYASPNIAKLNFTVLVAKCFVLGPHSLLLGLLDRFRGALIKFKPLIFHSLDSYIILRASCISLWIPWQSKSSLWSSQDHRRIRGERGYLPPFNRPFSAP